MTNEWRETCKSSDCVAGAVWFYIERQFKYDLAAYSLPAESWHRDEPHFSNAAEG